MPRHAPPHHPVLRERPRLRPRATVGRGNAGGGNSSPTSPFTPERPPRRTSSQGSSPRRSPPARSTCRSSKSILSIDWARTFAIAAERLEHRHATVLDEAAAVRHLGPSLVVSDAPFLAGDVAEALGVLRRRNKLHVGLDLRAVRRRAPVGGRRGGDGPAVVPQDGGASPTAFRSPGAAFREVIPVPLVARRGRLEREDVLSRLPSHRQTIAPASWLPCARHPPGRARSRCRRRPGLPVSDSCNAANCRRAFRRMFTPPAPKATSTFPTCWPSATSSCRSSATAPSPTPSPRTRVYSGPGGSSGRTTSPKLRRRATCAWRSCRSTTSAPGRWRRSLEQAMALPPPTADISTQGAACAAFLAERLASVA